MFVVHDFKLLDADDADWALIETDLFFISENQRFFCVICVLSPCILSYDR
jgi:hypothetical protein